MTELIQGAAIVVLGYASIYCLSLAIWIWRNPFEYEKYVRRWRKP